MGKNAKLKEKQKWSNEKLHLDNARKLRGIYFIDPGDKEFKETIKNTRKKLETPIALAMLCVRITVFCSAIVIDVIVHCHTAGALLSQSAENNCPYHRVVGF